MQDRVATRERPRTQEAERVRGLIRKRRQEEADAQRAYEAQYAALRQGRKQQAEARFLDEARRFRLLQAEKAKQAEQRQAERDERRRIQDDERQAKWKARAVEYDRRLAEAHAEWEARQAARRERHAARRALIEAEQERQRIESEAVLQWQPTAEELAQVPVPRVRMLEADWVNEQMRLLRNDRRFKDVRFGLKLRATPIRDVMERYGVLFTQLPTASAATLAEIIQEALDRERKQHVSEVRRKLLQERRDKGEIIKRPKRKGEEP